MSDRPEDVAAVPDAAGDAGWMAPASPAGADGTKAVGAGALCQRERLPDRRPSVTRTIKFPPGEEVDGSDFDLGISFDPETGIVRELFMDGYKTGSDAELLLDAFCMVISRLLQYGERVADLGRRISGSRPEDQIMSYMLAVAAEEDPQPRWWAGEAA